MGEACKIFGEGSKMYDDKTPPRKIRLLTESNFSTLPQGEGDLLTWIPSPPPPVQQEFDRGHGLD